MTLKRDLRKWHTCSPKKDALTGLALKSDSNPGRCPGLTKVGPTGLQDFSKRLLGFGNDAFQATRIADAVAVISFRVETMTRFKALRQRLSDNGMGGKWAMRADRWVTDLLTDLLRRKWAW